MFLFVAQASVSVVVHRNLGFFVLDAKDLRDFDICLGYDQELQSPFCFCLV